jgi:hypothetical protein
MEKLLIILDFNNLSAYHIGQIMIILEKAIGRDGFGKARNIRLRQLCRDFSTRPEPSTKVEKQRNSGAATWRSASMWAQ